MALSEATLRGYLGKHIREVCGNGYTADSDNHCAHFVSHVLGFRFGANCALMAPGATSGNPASIRVQDLFGHCLQTGPWAQLPVPLYWGLVFITNPSNVRGRSMVNVPRKHVGIFFGGNRMIYHYSNSRRQVVSQTPAQFSQHYPAPDNAMYWGSTP